MNNYLNKSLYLVLLTIGFISLTGIINDWLGNPFDKRIDLLTDLRVKQIQAAKVITDTVELTTIDSTIVSLLINEEKITGPVYFEDYTSNHNGIDHLRSSLRYVKSNKVRIAFYGDSFIEGDILCGSFRDTLQSVFGGHGVGYVPIASEVAQFRMSIKHSFEGWETYSLVNKKKADAPLGFSGYCFKPYSENRVTYQSPRKLSPPFNQLRLFYSSFSPNRLEYSIGDSTSHSLALTANDGLQSITLDINSKEIHLKFIEPDSLFTYGASLESNNGIYIDNFAMRGNSGMGLSLIASREIQKFNAIQDYKLVILQYGLNVVHEDDSLGYDWYIEKMVRTINHLKEAMPEADFLLLSVSDRSSNQDGVFATIPAIPTMRDAQRIIAQRTKIMFWDMFTAMGGNGTMVNFVNANPPLGAKDFTHLTYQGGKIISRKLTDALLYELKKNEKAQVF